MTKIGIGHVVYLPTFAGLAYMYGVNVYDMKFTFAFCSPLYTICEDFHTFTFMITIR